MRGKKAKQLRNRARELSIGLPNVHYERVRCITRNPLEKKYMIRVAEGCTRFNYLAIKWGYKNGKI